MKTSELSGPALDWAVAEANGNVRLQYDSREGLIISNILGWIPYRPSVAWQQGGPIIEQEKIGVWWATHYVDDDGVESGNHWYAETAEGLVGDGPTPLIAAMKCFVASRLGDEVDVPDELLGE